MTPKAIVLVLALVSSVFCLRAGDRVGPNGMFEIIRPFHEVDEDDAVSFLNTNAATSPESASEWSASISPLTEDVGDLSPDSSLDSPEKTPKAAWGEPNKMIYYQKRATSLFTSLEDSSFSKKLIGEGSFGKVYHARMKPIGSLISEDVVLKFFPDTVLGALDDSTQSAGMVREIYLHGRATELNAPNLAKCLRADESGVGCWVMDNLSPAGTILVLEKYTQDLHTYIKEQSLYLTTDDALKFLKDLISGCISLSALGLATEDGAQGIAAPCAEKNRPCGWVHLDLKPKNILLKGGHAYVHDFGLAEYVRQGLHVRLLDDDGKGVAYHALSRSDGISPLVKAAVTWGFRPPELICHSAKRDDTQESFFKLCKEEIEELAKKNDYSFMTYFNAPISEPHYATDVFSLGTILLRMLKIGFPKEQTRHDVNEALDFMFLPITVKQKYLVQEERVHWLLKKTLTKHFNKLSPLKLRLICLASLMVDSDPYRRPSWVFLQKITDLIDSDKFPTDEKHVAFSESCQKAYDSLSWD